MNKYLTEKERATLIVIRIVVSLLVAGLPIGVGLALYMDDFDWIMLSVGALIVLGAG